MEKIEMWIAQNESGSCLIYKYKPIKGEDGYHAANCLAYGYVGNNILGKGMSPEPVKVELVLVEEVENES